MNQFEAIVNTQGQALERLFAQQPTNNPTLMSEARADLESAIIKAIQASKDINDGDL